MIRYHWMKSMNYNHKTLLCPYFRCECMNTALYYSFLLYCLYAVERHWHYVDIFFKLENDCLLLLNIFSLPLKASQQGINFCQMKTWKRQIHSKCRQLTMAVNGTARWGIQRKILHVLQHTWQDLTGLFWTERPWFMALQCNYSGIYSEIVDSDWTYEDVGTTEITCARQGLII